MSTAAATLDRPLATGAFRRPSLARLTAVELRKMIDTRAGFWLQLAVVASTIVVMVIVCIVGDAKDHTLRSLFSVAVTPSSVLLPVVGVLLVTSEWSQRTSLITFALVPHRSRVLAAKVAASVLLSLVALVLCLAIAAVGTIVTAPGVENTWTLPAGMLGQIAVTLGTGMMGGVAFGAVLLASAPAIVALFLLPTVTGALGSIHALEGPARWLDSTRSLAPMTDHLMSATEWARAGTTLALWLALPIVIGLWRIHRSEVS